MNKLCPLEVTYRYAYELLHNNIICIPVQRMLRKNNEVIEQNLFVALGPKLYDSYFT